MIIEDGTGTGRKGKVDEVNRVWTFSDTRSMIAAASQVNASAYIYLCPLSAITATGGRVLWFRNDTPGYTFVLSKIMASWNGGSTNHNRACQVYLAKGDSVPTANNTQFTAGNMNLSSVNAPVSTSYYWNGTGDGMTIVTPGTPIGFLQLGQGMSILDVDDSIVIPYNSVISCNMKGEEVGVGSIMVSGYFMSTSGTL